MSLKLHTTDPFTISIDLTLKGTLLGLLPKRSFLNETYISEVVGVGIFGLDLKRVAMI